MVVHRTRFRAAGAVAIAMGVFAGCDNEARLRVVASESSYRAGHLDVRASSWSGDQASPLMHDFTDPQRTSATFLFRFEMQHTNEFLAVVTTHFTPAVPRSDECILQCSHFMELRRGHSYRIQTPIVILPYACPPPEDWSAAIDVCADANRLVHVPGCQFVVTSAHQCDLMCFGEPPDDSDPGAPADETAQQAADLLGPPNMDPTIVDASRSDDASTTDGSMDASTDAPMDATAADTPMLPAVCGGFANDCDGRVLYDLCPSGSVCSGGQCLAPCVEGACNPGQSCTSSNLCVDTACVGVTCSGNQVCVRGTCVDPCAR